MGKFNFKDEKDFEEVAKKAEEFYATIGEIRCPFWKIDMVKSRRILHSGDAEHD